MESLILHHHDPSPFAEKIRLVFGVKNLSWSSVQIPMIMPKPDLTILTGGYRKTPVLQIGANVYCDSAHIARELEMRFPDPGLFPEGSKPMAWALGRWSDTAFFEPGAALSMGENPDIPEAVLEDRKDFFNFMDFERMEEAMPHAYAQFQAQCQLLEDELSETSSTFLAGDTPGWVDILAYFPVWMAQGNIPRSHELLGEFSAIQDWAQRMGSVGHGHRQDISAASALEQARNSEPEFHPSVASGPFHNFSAGDPVTVASDDYGAVPVGGELVALSHHEIVILRHNDQLGNTAIHFPRRGFELQAA